MHFITKTTFLTLSLACILAGCATESVTPIPVYHANAASTPISNLQSGAQDPVVMHGLYHQRNLDDALDWNQRQYEMEIAGGIEPAKAGLHVIYSSVVDPDVSHPSFPSLQESAVRDWRFWRAKPYYDASYTYSDSLSGTISREVDCHADRATVNGIFQYSLSVDSVSGLYSVIGTANDRSIAVLRMLVADQSVDSTSGDFVDWYGIERTSVEDPTPFRLVVASDDYLYRPLNVSAALKEIDADALTSYQFTLADELSQTEASTLLSRLGQ